MSNGHNALIVSLCLLYYSEIVISRLNPFLEPTKLSNDGNISCSLKQQ